MQILNLQACQSLGCCRLNYLGFFWIKHNSLWLNWEDVWSKTRSKYLTIFARTAVYSCWLLKSFLAKTVKIRSCWHCWPRNQAIDLHKQYVRKKHKTTFPPQIFLTVFVSVYWLQVEHWSRMGYGTIVTMELSPPQISGNRMPCKIFRGSDWRLISSLKLAHY